MTRRILTLVTGVVSVSVVFLAGCASDRGSKAPYSLTGRDATVSGATDRQPSDDINVRREAARGNYRHSSRS